MSRHESRVCEEIQATLGRAGFDELCPADLRIDVTDSFRRKLGECRRYEPTNVSSPSYEIRIASRLFEDADEAVWRDTIRHEIAHAYVLETVGPSAQPHGEHWKKAARRAGADPVARHEGTDTVEASYVLACPSGCFERGYVKRAKRIKQPWEYTCDTCDRPTISYDVGQRPSEPDPGRCYVESLPWETKTQRDDESETGSRYLLACPNGCTSWTYQRRSKRIKRPWLYYCRECEATLLSCDIDDDPESLTAGQCHVDSIPWQTAQYVHTCPNGCFRTGYGKLCEQILEPEEFRCESCGSRTVAFPVDDRPETLAPATSYVGSETRG